MTDLYEMEVLTETHQETLDGDEGDQAGVIHYPDLVPSNDMPGHHLQTKPLGTAVPLDSRPALQRHLETMALLSIILSTLLILYNWPQEPYDF